MTGSLHYFSFDFSFPATEPPAWAGAVERWYQLDAPAFGLPHAFEHWRLRDVGLRKPDFLVFASPDGSNPTDYDFALSLKATGAASPSKFVHTLPNSRSSALLQVMNHGGPMICVQNDPATFVTGLALAFERVHPGGSPTSAWVLGVTGLDEGRHRCHLFQLIAPNACPQKGAFSWRPRRFDDNGKNPIVTDSQLLAWLTDAGASRLALSASWELEQMTSSSR